MISALNILNELCSFVARWCSADNVHLGIRVEKMCLQTGWILYVSDVRTHSYLDSPYFCTVLFKNYAAARFLNDFVSFII